MALHGTDEKKKHQHPQTIRSRLEQAKQLYRNVKAKVANYAQEKIHVVLDNLPVVASWFNAMSLKNIQTVNPVFAEILPRAKQIFCSLTKGIEVQINEGGRTTKEQQDKYAQGRSRPGKIVTHADGVRDKSNHQSPGPGLPGQAVDFSIYKDGQYITNGSDPLYRKFWECVQKAAAEKGVKDMQWGGNWTGSEFDPSHLQYMGADKEGKGFTTKRATPAFKKACYACKQPQKTPGQRIMDQIVPEGGVLDSYFKAHPLPSQNLFKMP